MCCFAEPMTACLVSGRVFGIYVWHALTDIQNKTLYHGNYIHLEINLVRRCSTEPELLTWENITFGYLFLPILQQCVGHFFV